MLATAIRGYRCCNATYRIEIKKDSHSACSKSNSGNVVNIWFDSALGTPNNKCGAKSVLACVLIIHDSDNHLYNLQMYYDDLHNDSGDWSDETMVPRYHYSLPGVMAHEFGHSAGLYHFIHSSGSQLLMYTLPYKGDDAITGPKTGDEDAMEALYLGGTSHHSN